MNETWTAIAALLGTVAGVAGLPVWVVQVLGLGSALIQQGEEALGQLKALNDKVAAMVAAGRDPTDEELDELKAMSDAAHTAIQASGNKTS